jgi:hypothetical protein
VIDRDRTQRKLDFLNACIGAFEAWQETHELHINDKLYPSKDFVRHLLDHTLNKTHQISVWISPTYLVVVGFSCSYGGASTTIQPVRGGMKIDIPLDLALNMRKEWLLTEEAWRKDRSGN